MIKLDVKWVLGAGLRSPVLDDFVSADEIEFVRIQKDTRESTWPMHNVDSRAKE
jgi:hypothetical protein